MAKVKELSREEFRKMQLLQLEMLQELDRVCRIYDIKYTIFCGTLLGAVRHKGYIPWDDDADVGMLREDYEKFKRISQEMNQDICYFQDHGTDKDYLWGYGKLRKTNTVFVREGQEHLRGKTGVFIDVFPLDDIPGFLGAQMVQDFYCFCLRKILWAQVAKVNEKGLKKLWYKMISHISPEFVHKRVLHMAKKSSNDTENRVRTYLFPSFGKLCRKDNPLKIKYGMPKEWFKNRDIYEFEGKKLYGIKDYDAFLSYTYGDYMTLPPEDKRVPHAPVTDYKL